MYFIMQNSRSLKEAFGFNNIKSLKAANNRKSAIKGKYRRPYVYQTSNSKFNTLQKQAQIDQVAQDQ